MAAKTEFSSEGFDLDAMTGEGGSDAVIYELGGGATVVKPPTPTPSPSPPPAEEEEPSAPPLDGIAKAEDWKKQGNEQFKQGQFLEAYDLYTEAIMACPGEFKGGKILKLRDEFQEKERIHAIERQRKADEERRKRDKGDKSSTTSTDTISKPGPPAEFKLPQQEHGDKLAMYYCNRAAALHNMDRYEEAVKDCTVSCLLDPKYTKAFVRRSTAHEKSERTDEALRDAKKALELDPSNATVRRSVARLQKIEDERLEKLKDETMGKLFCLVGLSRIRVHVLER